MPRRVEYSNDFAAILRERHQFENEQMHKRLSWLGSFQAFLFAGVCVAWKERESAPLIAIIAGLGLAVALQSILALSGVGFSLIKIHRLWIKNNLDKRNDLGVFGLYQGSKVSEFWIFPWPEVFIPIVFSVAWGLVLYVKFWCYTQRHYLLRIIT